MSYQGQASSVAWTPDRRRVVKTLVGGALTAGATVGSVWTTRARAADPVRIGIINDQNGPYSGLGGPGSVVAARLAIEDFGPEVLGRPITLLVADHQNKPDIGSSIARQWLDEGVSAIADGGSSSVGLAVQYLTRERDRTFLNTGSTVADFYGKECSPNAVQWITDTYTATNGSIRSFMTDNKAQTRWFTAVVDAGAGHEMERFAQDAIGRNGGKTVDGVRFPLSTGDFSSILLRAQASGAQAIALGVGGTDAVNFVKQLHEFGLQSSISLIGLATTISDLEAMGHEAAAGQIWITNFYWDRDEASRAWTKRFRAQHDRLPTRIQASTYGAVLHYLKAVQAVGSDHGAEVVRKMRELPVTDPLFAGTTIRADGKAIAPLLLMRTKKPDEIGSDDDWAAFASRISGEQAYRPIEDGNCPFLAAK